MTRPGAGADADLELELVAARAPFFTALGKWVRHQPLGALSGGGVIVMILIAVLAPHLAPFDPVAAHYDNMAAAPSFEYWLGTDQFGRDLMSRVIWGARTALFIGFTSAILGSTLGLVFGVTSAYFGGWFDLLFQRVMDVFLAFPLIIMALAVVAIFGTGPGNVIIAITIPFVPRCARVVRSNALTIREMPYVDAARALGYGHLRIILRHMAPNCMAPYLIMLTTFLGQAILLEAALSYLGLGVQEPIPAWGLMLQGGAEEYAESAPWIAIFPGLAITLAVFAFNLFGDSVRDTLDPKLRAR
ncbi:MAG: ABC transporter permease [Burkholderiales bacterium]|nr:ABC transporter permease [Burkholderiales bacterium]